MNKVTVIAEAGVNHNGSLDKAIALIDVAAAAGADYVKFQTFRASNLATQAAQKTDYQKNNVKGSTSQMEMLRQLEIPVDWYPNLLKRCKEKKIGFLSTGFDLESIDFLDNLGQEYFKIPSGEITHKALLERIAQKSKPIILSTGMATLEEIKMAVDILLQNGIDKKFITVLHCTTAYPTPLEEVNLMAINHIQKELSVNVGYSDHTLGIAVATAAVALGATVIEKHFTLDKTLPGPDHQASLEPIELEQMVHQIREVSKAIKGDGKKAPTPSEIKNRTHVRKSLCYASNLSKGKLLEACDFIALRPENGLSPMLLDDFIGKSLKQDVHKLQLVNKNDFI